MLLSCRKEIKHSTSSGDLSELLKEEELYFVKPQSKPKNGEKTILGEKIINPNKISFIEDLTKQMGVEISKEKLMPTHLYIKFLPQSVDDMARLVKRMDEDTTFLVEQIPFHYKVEQYGKKFDNPEKLNGGLPPLYTTVKWGYKLPNVKYEVLDSMLLPYDKIDFTPQEEFAVKMAELIGMAMNGEIEFNEDYLDAMIDSLGIDLDEVELNMEGLPSTYFFRSIVKAVKKVIAIAVTVVKKTLHYIQKAVEIFFPDDHIKGYVNVENKENSDKEKEPLNGMRLNVRRFFVYYDVTTSPMGYFSTRERCPKGLLYNVYLGNHDNLNNKIQSGITEQFDYFGELLTYLMNTFTSANWVGEVRSGNNGKGGNNIDIKKSSNFFGQQLWNKALVCNSIKEYNVVARENGMVEYKNSKLWLGLEGLPGGGMAGMFYTFESRHIDGFQNDYADFMVSILYLLKNTGGAVIMYDLLPDILIHRRDDENSLYRTVFHELTHYSHAVEHEHKYSFWGKVAWGEARNSLTQKGDPYGDGTTPSWLDQGHSVPNAIGLAESWAYFMQEYVYYMYRQKNNPNRYNDYIKDSNIAVENYVIRKIPYKDARGNDGWFPTGLYHNMIDSVKNEIKMKDKDGNMIFKEIDLVSGFNVRDMYRWVTHSYSVESFMEKAMQTMPADGYYFDHSAFDKALNPYLNTFIVKCEDFKRYYGLKNAKGSLYRDLNTDLDINLGPDPEGSIGSSSGSSQGGNLTQEGIASLIQDLIYLVDGLRSKPKNGLSDLVRIENIIKTLRENVRGVQNLRSEYTIYSNKYRELEAFYNRQENKIFKSPKGELESLFRVYRTRI